MDYIKVDVLEYVKQGIESGTMQPIVAEKFARIIARPGVLGEEVVTWSVDSDGRAIKEKVDTVKIDEKTGKPGWVVTKANETGEAVIDNNGNTNTWIIDDSTFQKKYEMDVQMNGIFKPTGGPQTFVPITDNIILEQCGSEMQIASGGMD